MSEVLQEDVEPTLVLETETQPGIGTFCLIVGCRQDDVPCAVFLQGTLIRDTAGLHVATVDYYCEKADGSSPPSLPPLVPIMASYRRLDPWAALRHFLRSVLQAWGCTDVHRQDCTVILHTPQDPALNQAYIDQERAAYEARKR